MIFQRRADDVGRDDSEGAGTAGEEAAQAT